jgi:dephospho-CoA kinase
MPTTSGSQRNRQRLIGLTGGIATGKTTVANYLATVHQLPILDADRYAREAVQPGSAILRRIVERYGPTILADGEHLDRQHLGDIVFQDNQERRWLEAQIHPYVGQCFQDMLAALQDQSTIILVIPLLFEAQLEAQIAQITGQITEIWVVSCSPQQQLERLLQRDHFSLEAAQARIQAQMSLAQKCDCADQVLDNSSTLAALLNQVDQALHNNTISQQFTSPCS